MKPIIALILIGKLTLTSYRSVPGQTDDSPFETSINEKVGLHGAAISQDLLCTACRRLHHRCAHPEVNKWVHYGDCLYVEGVGFKIVNDVMGKVKHYRVRGQHGSHLLFIKQLKWVDIWQPSYQHEHEFHKKHGINKTKVWKIQIGGNYERCIF